MGKMNLFCHSMPVHINEFMLSSNSHTVAIAELTVALYQIIG